MVRFILIRTLQALFSIYLVTTAVFFLARVTGDPVDLLLPVEATAEDAARIRALWGLDQPMWVQYTTYLSNAVRGDFGTSLLFRGRDAFEVVISHLPATLSLGFFALLWSGLLGALVGFLAALKPNSLIDTVANVTSAIGQSMPAYWLGIVLIFAFSVQLGWLPVSGMGDGSLRYYVLPAITMGWFQYAAITRLMRSSMLDVLDRQYMLLAEAKGLAYWRVAVVHGLKNAMSIPLTYFGIVIGVVLTGSVAVETVFGWPGIGRLAIQAVLRRDFVTLQVITIMFMIIYLLANLLVDVLYGVIDPRVRARVSS